MELDRGTNNAGPFEHYPASGWVIRAAAETTRGRLSAVDAVREQVGGLGRTLIDSVEGQLEDSAADAPTDAHAHADSVTQKATYAAGAVEMFAHYVDVFDRESTSPRSVSALNAAYIEASSGDFGVPPTHYPKDATAQQRTSLDNERTGTISQARQATMSTLQAEYGRLQDVLDQNAAQVSAMLDHGPNDKDLRAMYAVGALPSYATVIYPDVNFDGVMVTALPYDLRQMSDKQLAAWLVEHDEAEPTLVDVALRDTDVAHQVGLRLAHDVGDETTLSSDRWDDLRRLGINQDVGAAFVYALGPHQVAKLVFGRQY
ncbi:MAG TPA: hypothetical protein VH419_10180, partial [Nocardioidaceae bacterium]